MTDSYEKNLIGSSIPLPEMDDEKESFLNGNLIDDSIINADFMDLVSKLNSDEFKLIYLNLYNEIYGLQLEQQRILCDKLVEKIKEEFDFDFTPKLEFNNQSDINDFFKFIEFLTFDYINFLAEIIENQDFNEIKKNLKNYLKSNWNLIQLQCYNYNPNNKIISQFLRTNSKEGLFGFIFNKLDKHKMLVILKVLEKERGI